MFGSMGMFGAFGCDPEEVAKKNEEMKREAEARRKFEENLDKPITITKRQFMELSATVVAQGGFMDKAVEHEEIRAVIGKRCRGALYLKKHRVIKKPGRGYRCKYGLGLCSLIAYGWIRTGWVEI